MKTTGKITNQSGVSLIEVMMIVAIMGIMASGMTALITTQTRQAENLRSAMSKDSLLSTMRTLAGNPFMIQNTVLQGQAGNAHVPASFVQCVNGVTAAGGCTQALGSQPVGFALFGSNNANDQISGEGPMPAINTAVAAGSVMFYGSDGSRCPNTTTTPSAQCAFGVTTSFYATSGFGWPNAVAVNVPLIGPCPGPSCNTATQIAVFYDIKLLYSPPGQFTNFKENCNQSVATWGGANAICSDYNIVVQMPLQFAPNMLATGRLPIWSSSTTMLPAAILSAAAGTAPPCNAGNLGMIYTTTGNNQIQLCVQKTLMVGAAPGVATPTYGWIDLTSGPPAASGIGGVFGGTGNLAQHAASMPYMQGMYLCPTMAELTVMYPPGANHYDNFVGVCGGMPVCGGQLQADPNCCSVQVPPLGSPNLSCWGPTALWPAWCVNAVPAKSCYPLF